ncbi:MAG: hypothetical protein ACRC4M_03345 [Mycoplasma sp.]
MKIKSITAIIKFFRQFKIGEIDYTYNDIACEATGNFKVSGIKEELKMNKQNDINSLTKRVDSLETGMKELNNRVGSLETGMKELNNRVGSLENNVSSLQNDVNCLSNRVGSIETGMKELTEIVINGFAMISKRLDKIDDVLERNNLH